MSYVRAVFNGGGNISNVGIKVFETVPLNI